MMLAELMDEKRAVSKGCDLAEQLVLELAVLTVVKWVERMAVHLAI